MVRKRSKKKKPRRFKQVKKPVNYLVVTVKGGNARIVGKSKSIRGAKKQALKKKGRGLAIVQIAKAWATKEGR